MKYVYLISLVALLVPLGARDSAWVDHRVSDWQPTVRERAWEQIGWAKDLRSAERLCRSANRPVFLFTHDGRLNVGRC